MSKARLSLFPFSVIYDGITRFKNFLYDSSILKSAEFKIPLIVIGNLSVGGTGKTPHTELVANWLKANFNTAVLSRGYGRKTKGYYLANSNSTSQEIGDEPLQIYNTVNGINVAVCEDRTTGVKHLIDSCEPEVIILDDAFQHRKIQGSFYILLSTYQKPFYDDYILPAGNLRESSSNKKRAELIIVTKCPSGLSAIDRDKVIKKMRLTSSQKVLFSEILYDKPIPFNDESNWESAKKVLLVTGIVNPLPLKEHIESVVKDVKLLTFQDHHDYSKKDIQLIKNELQKMGDHSVLVTTSKDAVKLKPLLNKHELPAFELPIKIGLLFNQENEFKNIIIEHVRKI